MFITRKFHFSASHKVYNPAFSDEENLRIFGKCANPNGHGHNYVLDVTVSGEVEQSTGFVMDLKELKELVNDVIIEKVDHKNFNTDVDFVSGIIPTTENIVIAFWYQLEPIIKTGKRKLHSIKLQETINNSVEYRGK